MGFFRSGNVRIDGVFFMSYNTESTIDEKGVTLVAIAGAWLVEFTLTPPEGTVIGCYSYHFSSYTLQGQAQVYSYSPEAEDYEKRYTSDNPFYASITQSDCYFLDESRSYSLAVSYSIYEDGEEIETNRVISVNIATVSRAESGDGGVLAAELPVKYVSSFPGSRICGFSICIDFINYAGGNVNITLLLSSDSGQILLDKTNMTYIEYNDSENQIKERYYSTRITSDDIGFGKISAVATVQYYPNNNGSQHWETTGTGTGTILFGFSTLEQNSPFKIKASEWNELATLFENALSGEGITQHIDSATKYTFLTLNHINTMAAAINTCIQLGIFEADYLPFCGYMTFGKRPDGGKSGYELFSELEACANKLIESSF